MAMDSSTWCSRHPRSLVSFLRFSVSGCSVRFAPYRWPQLFASKTRSKARRSDGDGATDAIRADAEQFCLFQDADIGWKEVQVSTPLARSIPNVFFPIHTFVGGHAATDFLILSSFRRAPFITGRALRGVLSSDRDGKSSTTSDRF